MGDRNGYQVPYLTLGQEDGLQLAEGEEAGVIQGRSSRPVNSGDVRAGRYEGSGGGHLAAAGGPEQRCRPAAVPGVDAGPAFE